MLDCLHVSAHVPPLLLCYFLASILEKVLDKKILLILIPHILIFYFIWYQPNYLNRSVNGSLWTWTGILCLLGVFYLLKKISHSKGKNPL